VAVVALAAVAVSMPSSALAGSSDGADSVALPVVLVHARRGARASALALIRVLDTVRLLVRLAVLVLVDMGADALPDAVIVPRRAGRLGVDIGASALVVVVRADLVLAAHDYLGDALCQLPRVMASGSGHGNGRPPAERQDSSHEARGPLAEDP
jgi:hypothetical protein